MSNNAEAVIFNIGKSYLTNENGKTLLNADIKAGNDLFTLWYRIDDEYKQYLVTERCDPFVVVLLPWVMLKAKKMQKEVVLKCENKVSARLWHQLTAYYIPTLSRLMSYFGFIRLEAETDGSGLPYVDGGRIAGGSVSGGLDSFYTIVKYKDYPVKEYQLTHVMYCNFGLYGGLEGDSELALYEKTRQIARETGLQYVHSSTNVIAALYGGMGHPVIVTAALTSVVLSLQKLFAYYHFSAALPVWDFVMTEKGAYYYELFNKYCLSTENTHFFLSGLELLRIDKAAYIADNPVTQNYLLPCVTQENGVNCNICAQCTRTMAALEVLGKLDLFSKVFNVEDFRNNEGYHWGYLLMKSKANDSFAKEIVDLYLEKNGQFPETVEKAAHAKWEERGNTASNTKFVKIEDIIR